MTFTGRGGRATGAIRATGALIAIAALVLSGCGDASTGMTARQKAVRGTDSNVRFTNCGASCTGEIDGAKYAIKLPQKWNGTLLLYSHGYRFAQPGPPDFSPVSTAAQVSSTDTDGTGSDELSSKLLADGYALAGSSYKSNGWAVADGVAAGVALHDKFVTLVGKPKRTYVWGDSLGGLITEIIAEENPSWVDGAAPMCGAVAGPNLNFDAALDVAFAIKTLIDPSLKLTGYASSDEANANWKSAAQAVVAAASDVAHGGTAKVLFIAALVNAPTQTKTYDGHDTESQVKATVEALLTALAFGTAGRYELEQRVGGNPSGNEGTDYATRITDSENSLVDTVGGNAAQYEQALADAPRITPDDAARTAFEKLGDTTGDLHAPTLTLHTEADPLVLVANESVLAQRVHKHHDDGLLAQLYAKAPQVYPESTGAPYGAGHCNFSEQQRLGLVSTLDKWVRQGVYPVPVGVAAAFGPGIDVTYTPGTWPSEATP